MKFKHLLAAMTLPIMVAGCSSLPGSTVQLDELRGTSPVGTPFTQALAREYLAFADAQKDEYDWINSQKFAIKGLDAAHGTLVPPENPSDWDISDPKQIKELNNARVRLVSILASTAPKRVPALSATAQVKYDCWIEESEENDDPKATEACHKDFGAAMDAIAAQFKVHAVPAQPAMVKPSDRYLVFFDFNGDRLTDEGTRIVAEVVKAAKAAKYPRLSLIGYTDLAGSDKYNLSLSLRRALAVKKALVAAGVPADHLGVEGRGKADPLVPTADGVREPQNRRVAVRFGG